MEQIASLAIVVKAQDQASQVLEAVKGKVNETSGVFGSLSKVVAVTGVAIGASLVAASTYAVDAASHYETATSRIAAQANISQQSANAISQAFLSTAGTTVQSAQSLSEAYGNVAGQLGLTEGHALSAADALTVMKVASEGAEATQSSLNSVTSALSDVMQTYHLTVSQASDAMDYMYNAARVTGNSIESIASSTDRLHLRLGPLTPSLADTSTMMVDLAQHGVQGSRAMMMVSSGFNTLLGHSKATKDELEKLGITIYTSSGQFVGMQSVIAQLQPKLVGLTEQQRLTTLQTLFGSSASRELYDTILSGVPAWQSAADAVQQHGSASHAADMATDSLHGKLEKLNAAVQDTAVKFGQVLLPYVKGFLDWVSGNLVPFIDNTVLPALGRFASWFESNAVPAIQKFVQWIGQNVVPVIVGQLIPAIVNVGTFLWNNFINPLVHVAEAVIPPLLSVLDALVTHLNLLIPALVGIATIWGGLKIVGWIEEIQAAAAAFKALAGEEGIEAAARALGGIGPAAQAATGEVVVSAEEQAAAVSAAAATQTSAAVTAANTSVIANSSAAAEIGAAIDEMAIHTGLAYTTMTGDAEEAAALTVESWDLAVGQMANATEAAYARMTAAAEVSAAAQSEAATAGSAGFISKLGSKTLTGTGAVAGIATGLIGSSAGGAIGTSMGGQLGGEIGSAAGGVLAGGATGFMFGGPVGAMVGAMAGLAPTLIEKGQQFIASSDKASKGLDQLGNLQNIMQGGGGGFLGMLMNTNSAMLASDMAGIQKSMSDAHVSSAEFSQVLNNMLQAVKDGSIKTDADVKAYEQAWGQLNQAGIHGADAQKQTSAALDELHALTSKGVKESGSNMQTYLSAWTAISKVHGGTELATAQLNQLITQGLIKNTSDVNSYLSAWAGSGLNTQQLRDGMGHLWQAIDAGQITNSDQINQFIKAWSSIVASTGFTDLSYDQVQQFAGLASQHGQDFADTIASLATSTHSSINQIISAYTSTAAFSESMLQHQIDLNNALDAGIVNPTTGAPIQRGSLLGSQHGEIITSETVRRVGEGGVKEWIIPQSKARGFDALLTALVMGSSLPGLADGGMTSGAANTSFGSGDGQPILVVVQLDGRQIAQAMSPHLAKQGRLAGYTTGAYGR